MENAPSNESQKEDVSSERDFFDGYYRETRNIRMRSGELEEWTKRADRPSPRPLDYWEYAFYLLGDIKGRRVLDIGCGGGWITRLLAAKGAFVTAFDISLEGAISTRERLKADGLSNGSVMVMDAHALALPNSIFDGAFITGVLHHLNTAKVALEIHRVLKPGGKVVFYEPVKYGPMMWALRQVWLQLKGMKEYETTAHEEGLNDSDIRPFNQIFGRGLVRRFNFIAKKVS